MSNSSREELRALVRGAYDMQRLRIQMGLRLVATFKSRLGMSPSTKEEDEDEDAKELLTQARLAMKRLSDTVAKVKPKGFKPEGIIDTYTEYVLAKSYIDLETQEQFAFKQIEKVLAAFPLYTEYLEGVKGCGPAMSAILISEIDIHKAKYPSSLWKYAGLDVGPDGAGRSRRSEHLIDFPYVNSKGEETVRKSITFNPTLKTKLLGVLASSFLRVGKERSKYAQVYYDYKNRLENRPDLADESKGHKHNMAMRYMIKIFLMDLHPVWRQLEGLPVSVPYHEAKLGIVHRKDAA